MALSSQWHRSTCWTDAYAKEAPGLPLHTACLYSFSTQAITLICPGLLGLTCPAVTQAGRIPPGSEPWCSACPEGWATTTVDAGFCQMCTPGTFAATAQSPACSACPAGAYANTWGTTACKHCIMGTFSNSSVSCL